MGFIVAFFGNLPWLLIAGMAALALRGKKDSTALMLQAGGAVGMFLLGLVKWLLVNVLIAWVLGAGSEWVSAARYVFDFLLFVALAAFALGYCLERWKLRKPAQVTATRVD